MSALPNSLGDIPNSGPALCVRAFQPDDLLSTPMPPSTPVPSHLMRLHWRRQLPGETSLTAVTGAGRVVACAGVQRMRSGVVRAWAFFAVDAGPWLRRLWRLQCAALAEHAGRLVLAWVDHLWRPSVRWARLLGFVPTDKQAHVAGRVLTLYGRAAPATFEWSL